MRPLTPPRFSSLASSKALRPQLCTGSRELSVLSLRTLHRQAYSTTTLTRAVKPPSQSSNQTPFRKMSTAMPERYKLVFFVPHSDLEKTKEAVFATGAGSFPGAIYTKCCFQAPGTGQFLPGDGAQPAIGAVGGLEKVEEMKVEIMCPGRSIMLKAVEALVKAHPYEEPAYEVYRMENV